MSPVPRNDEANCQDTSNSDDDRVLRNINPYISRPTGIDTGCKSSNQAETVRANTYSVPKASSVPCQTHTPYQSDARARVGSSSLTSTSTYPATSGSDEHAHEEINPVLYLYFPTPSYPAPDDPPERAPCVPRPHPQLTRSRRSLDQSRLSISPTRTKGRGTSLTHPR